MTTTNYKFEIEDITTDGLDWSLYIVAYEWKLTTTKRPFCKPVVTEGWQVRDMRRVGGAFVNDRTASKFKSEWIDTFKREGVTK